MLHQIVMILAITSLLDPIYARAVKVDNDSDSKTKVSTNAERRGGGEFFDANGNSQGHHGHGYKRRTPLVQPGVARYRYGYFDRQARAMVRVEVEQPVMLGRTEHVDNGYGTVNSPLYTYATGYGPSSSYGASDYGSSVPSSGTYGTSYNVHDSNPYGYQDTAASEYIVSGSSDPYGTYGSYDNGYQGAVYSDVGYPGSTSYDSGTQSADPSGYGADHGGSYDSSQQMAATGGDSSHSQGSGYDTNGTPSADSAAYRSNAYKRNGFQANNDQWRPSRTFSKR